MRLRRKAEEACLGGDAMQMSERLMPRAGP
jgi:hypothetical protein